MIARDFHAFGDHYWLSMVVSYKGHYSGGRGQSEQAIYHSKALVLEIPNLLSKTAEEFPLTRKKG
jgi:hypothetical protein